MNKEKFTSHLESTVDAKVAEVLANKEDGKRHLGYMDAITISSAIRNVFRNKLSIVPSQIEASISLSEAVLAPSQAEREAKIKAVVGISGGAAGMGMIIGAIGAALGWGATLISTVTTFFVGSSLVGPIGLGIAGLAIAGIAAYFAFSSDEEANSERYMKCLKHSLKKAIPHLWAEHGIMLSKD